MSPRDFGKNYPNLDAVLNGTVSGQVTEWPGIRTELANLINDYEDQLDLAYAERDHYASSDNV